MKDEVLDKVADLGAAAHLGAGVERVKEAVADAVEHGMDATKRAVKQSRRAAEDLVDDAEYKVKKHPLSMVGASFVIGLGLGAVIAIGLTRTGHSRLN